jgi:Pentapeptide repeats (8 copies)
VVLDRYAGSWFIAVSSLRGYDGSKNVRDEERSVGRKNLTLKQLERRRRWLRLVGIRGSTLRDWLPILIALLIPLFIFYGTTQITQEQANSEAKRAQQAQKIEKQRAEAERELAEQRAQDEALQAYLNQMSKLILDRKLLEADHGDPVHTLAQARTSTIILSLDAEHNESVTRFLSDSGLAARSKVPSKASVGLLSEIVLSHAKLSGAFLSYDNLSSSDLSGAFLSHANLIGADLSGARLRGADLSGANLSGARLRGADLNGANLSNTTLIETNLSVVLFLSEANLSGADLRDAKGITSEELDQQAASLEGATMPNGQKYEDWLKDREKRQQDE